jgi:hypothetical protein
MQFNKKIWNKQENSLIYYLCLNDFELMFLFNKKYQLAVFTCCSCGSNTFSIYVLRSKRKQERFTQYLEIESLT